jgi:hypothetical protein
VLTLAGYEIAVTAFLSDGEPRAEVRRGADRYVVPAGSGHFDIVPDLKSNLRMDGQYLLIHSDCGCTAHGASVSRVFAMRGGRLKQLGVVADDWDDPNPHRLGLTILDNQLESTRLTSHARAPNVIVPLHEVSGRLRFDPARCWQVNRDGYEKARLEVSVPDGRVLERETLASDFLYIVGVDKYCGRLETVGADLKAAQSLMPSDDFIELRKEIATMVIGRLPEE